MTSDIQLLNQWQNQRDSEAFAELVKRHSRLVYGAARRVLGDSTEAEDIAQECFLKLSGANPDATATSLGGWLYAVAVNRAIDRKRSRESTAAREQAYAETTQSVSRDLRQWRELESHLDQAIADLPEDTRYVIVAHYLEGEPHKAVAKRLGVSRSAATRRIQKAVDTLHEILKARGIEIAVATLTAGLTYNIAEAVPAAVERQLRKIALASSVDHPAPVAKPLLGKSAIALGAVALIGAVGLFFVNGNQPDTPAPIAAQPTEPASVTPEPEASTPSPQIVIAQATETETTTGETSTAAAADAEETSFTLRIVNADGEPIAGAEIYVAQHKINSPTKIQVLPNEKERVFSGPFISDDEGVARLDFIPSASTRHGSRPASALIRVRDAYVGVWRVSEDDVSARSTEAKLFPSKSVRGTVRVPQGFSLSDVTVSILVLRIKGDPSEYFGADFRFYGADPLPEDLRNYSSVNPDIDGSFEFRDLPTNGAVYLEANAPGLGPAQVAELDLSGEFLPEFNLEPEGQISGEIRWAGTNQPAQGVRVSTSAQGLPAVVGYVTSTITDSRGRYLLTNLMENDYAVWVPGSTQENPWVSAVVDEVSVTTGERTQGVLLYLEAGAVQQGWVRMEDTDEPVSGVGVSVLILGKTRVTASSAYTDEEGFFQIRVPTGNSLFAVSDLPKGFIYPDRERHFIRRSPEASALAPLNIKIKRYEIPTNHTPPKASFTGRVVDRQGRGLADVSVGYWHGRGRRLYERTDDDGRYKFEVTRPGPYRVVVGGERYSFAESKMYTPKAGQTYNVEDFTLVEYMATLEVRVFDESGQPIKGVTVAPNPENYALPHPKPTTNADGAIRIDYLPNGTFPVSFKKEGFKDVSLDFETNATYDVVLEPEEPTEGVE